MGPGSGACAYRACPAADYASRSFLRSVELTLRGLEQLEPCLLELLHAFGLEHAEPIRKVDAPPGQLVEQLLGFAGGAADGVAGDVAVIGDRIDRLLRHGVPGVRRDQLGDVEGFGIVRVLDAGRRPEHPLYPGSVRLQRAEPLTGLEHLLEGGVGETRVRDAGLAAQPQCLLAAD